MPRRIHTRVLQPGEIVLDAAQSHHARVVLRLADGETVEVFDDAGSVAPGVLVHDGAHDARVRVDRVDVAASDSSHPLRWIVAAAVPKGDRADWMVEKLSELGAEAFIPLAAARSVVLPEGRSKRDRWARLATESAKQSRRRGVMRIEELTSLVDALARLVPPFEKERPAECGWYLSTETDASVMPEVITRPLIEPFPLFIGPEGGWTVQEMQALARAGLTPVALTTTILRVETAAVAAASIVAVLGRRAGSATPVAGFTSFPADPEPVLHTNPESDHLP